MYSETEDNENWCSIPPNALSSQCIGHPGYDALLGGSSLEFDSDHKGEVKEECDTISGILGNGYVSKITVNDYTQQFPTLNPLQVLNKREIECTNIIGIP